MIILILVKCWINRTTPFTNFTKCLTMNSKLWFQPKRTFWNHNFLKMHFFIQLPQTDPKYGRELVIYCHLFIQSSGATLSPKVPSLYEGMGSIPEIPKYTVYVCLE